MLKCYCATVNDLLYKYISNCRFLQFLVVSVRAATSLQVKIRGKSLEHAFPKKFTTVHEMIWVIAIKHFFFPREPV